MAIVSALFQRDDAYPSEEKFPFDMQTTNLDFPSQRYFYDNDYEEFGEEIQATDTIYIKSQYDYIAVYDQTMRYQGTGFRYGGDPENPVLIAGTVTGISYYVSQVETVPEFEFGFTISDISISARALMNWTMPQLYRAMMSGNDRITGSVDGDNLLGYDGRDVVDGHDGNDRVDGGGGNDKLIGRNGDDTLVGGEGMDTLIGGRGVDRQKGGLGADTFVFNSFRESGVGEARDVILDFAMGEDQIDLSRIDASNRTEGNQAFEFIDDRPFSRSAGELRFNHGILAGDINGDGIADFEIRIGRPVSMDDLLL